uniref:Uncharacterized protein n=1 Tax=Anguilla anguilla TaxID=7936 RepID=A0A0E9RKU5_ANGAN
MPISLKSKLQVRTFEEKYVNNKTTLTNSNISNNK